jgi:long-chain acyl-CoA synthetase
MANRRGIEPNVKRRRDVTSAGILHTRALQDPEATALFCEDKKLSYGELDESSSRLACWLLEVGLQRGDRVAIHWCNSIEAVQILFAAFKTGLIAVPVNLRMKRPEVAWILEHSQSAICFCQPRLAPNFEQAGSGSYRTELGAPPQLIRDQSSALPAIREDELAVLLYTSGSTSKPKGVIHTHRTLSEVTRLIAENWLDPNDVVLIMTSMMHAIGLAGLLSAIRLGRPAVLLPAFDPAAALDAIQRFGCTCTIGFPALLRFLLEEQVRSPRDTTSLRAVYAGGDRVPIDLQERFAAVYGVPLREAFGMSETLPVCFNPLHAARPGSIGIPCKDVEVRIVDGADRDLPEGATGEMLVRSPANCIGYWGDPNATEALLRGGWVHTGDLASRDQEGYLWFQGRRKEIIVHAGSNISPQEVEEVLYHHPGVLEAGVIGTPDPVYGERVVAFVSLRNGAAPGEKELLEHLRTWLADYKVPERIFFTPELPKGATGKVHRLSLKSMAASL